MKGFFNSVCRTISLGKFGTFPANCLLGRPYNFTFDILDDETEKSQTRLRIVPPAELHAEALGNGEDSPDELRDDQNDLVSTTGVQFDIVGEDGEFLMRSNRLTIDDPSRQLLSMDEIEELKKLSTDGGKEIIKKIMAAHSALNEKTEFSLAKYTLRKSRKYLKRFSVLPMDLSILIHVLTDKESHKIMDLRDESLGLLCSWANVHATDDENGKKWLTIDDTGGLVVAALASRMGILYPEGPAEDASEDENGARITPANLHNFEDVDCSSNRISSTELPQTDQSTDEAKNITQNASDELLERVEASVKNGTRKQEKKFIPAMSASSNTITLLHAAAQPNLSILKYFSFDANNMPPSHPLYTHLKTVSWLQLLHPQEDAGYTEPEIIPDEILRASKSGKRANYFRKRRRWERVKAVVDSTREGNFDGIVIATHLELTTVLKHTIPLLKGGAQVAIYSPAIEPLLEIVDLFSRERKGAYMELMRQMNTRDTPPVHDEKEFPINPTLLLAPGVQTVRARQWQVLPGRTHPFMTSKGGAEGYILSATKALPVGGKVEARGKFTKKRKVDS